MSHEYPYDEGDTIVIGPECFAMRDGSVLSWRGENYVPQQAPLVPVSEVVEFLREAAAVSYRRESKHADGFTIAADLIEDRFARATEAKP